MDVQTNYVTWKGNVTETKEENKHHRQFLHWNQCQLRSMEEIEFPFLDNKKFRYIEEIPNFLDS